jgi:hypothetical protein
MSRTASGKKRIYVGNSNAHAARARHDSARLALPPTVVAHGRVRSLVS